MPRRFALVMVVALAMAPRVAAHERRMPPQASYGPWNRDLWLSESTDGRAFRARGVFVERGGVPSLTRTSDDRIIAAFQWFPLERPDAFDRIAVRISQDAGATWSDPEPIALAGLPDYLFRAFDPALVALKGGAVRLYFTSERGSSRSRRGHRAIFSAQSSDGIHYTFEPGLRFGLEDAETFDATVATLHGAWHLYGPMPDFPGRGYHAVSDDGLMFIRQPDVVVPGARSWLGAVIASPEGLRFYGSGGNGVWMATSSDGQRWTLQETSGVRGADPGVMVMPDGRTWLVTTGELRNDAKSGPRPRETPRR